MEQIYCTLFDSNYLDKGIVLYKSMCEHLGDFKLYVFAFNDKCCEILNNENFSNMTVIPLSQFETPELLKVKAERSSAEYCWTCTPWTIKHVLEKYNENCCTYIDADMMFFSSPQYIFDDMKQKNCSTLIIPHRFDPNDKKAMKHEKLVGKYCVEFNTFFNDDNGSAALDWWAQSCLDWCFYTPDITNGRYGDQKYLEEFEQRFDGVYVCDEYGVGIAPWNTKQLKLSEKSNGKNYIEVLRTGKQYPIVICHFASITFLSEHLVNVGSGIKDSKLRDLLYGTYMKAIREERKYLKEKYGLGLYIRRKVTNNKLRAFYQRYMASLYHLRNIHDIYRI